MPILATYVFLKDGRYAFSQRYSSDAPSPDFFGPLFAALDSFAKATVGQEMQGLEMGKIRVHVGDFGLYYVLLATDPDYKPRSDKISALIDQIGFKFWEIYFQDIGDWNGNVARFRGFNQICRNIIQQGLERVLPTRILDAISIIELERKLQKTALALLDNDGEAFPSDISEITQRDEELEQELLEILVKEGLVGRDVKEAKLYYFVDKHSDD
ncbi:MAG: hypothetical protein ACXAEL_10775 [Candidatus Hodarchaeales archaeon]|jgi:hypothetical protein